MQQEKLNSGAATLALGGITLCFVPTTSEIKLTFGKPYNLFISNATPDITFWVHNSLNPYLELGPPVFSGKTWTLHNVQRKRIIRLHNPRFGVYQLVVLEPGRQCGDIYCVGNVWHEREVSVLEYPAGEILLINLLAQRCGVLFHACSIHDGECGLLFSGTSGAGKSTMSRLWKGCEKVSLLSDDRVIVRKQGRRFWAYGTPWHGNAQVASPEAVPLERVFIIRHAHENTATLLKPADAASRLLVRSFPTFWDAEGMALTLKFLDELTRTVPCYDLGFVPDESVIDFVRCIT